MTGTGLGAWERDRLLEPLDSYPRGLSDVPLLHKWTECQAGPVESEGDLPIAFVISTDEVDRHGDVIQAQGWQLDAYLNNPVFLWARDYSRPVIGRASEVWHEPHRLLARMKFAPTDFAQKVAVLYRTGFQNGVSVGFKPLRYEERRHEKTGASLEQELLETSAVPVPANRNALTRALEQAPLVGEYLRRIDAIEHAAGGPSHDENSSNGSGAELVWPELTARVDELGKMASELAQMLEEAEQSAGSPASMRQLDRVVALIREARV